MQKRDKEVLIILTYNAARAQGKELELAVRGIRRFFRERYIIALAGDWHNIADSGNDIVHIDCPRIDHGNTTMCIKHLEFVRSIRKTLTRFSDKKAFVLWSDDEYLLHDIDLSYLMIPKVHSMEIGGDEKSNNSWMRDMKRTKDILLREGYPTLNYTSHTPMYFEVDKYLSIIDRYNMDSESYVIENLYYNIYNPMFPMFLNGQDSYRVGVWRENADLSLLDAMMQRKIFVTNSEDGYSKAFEEKISEYYDKNK